MIDCASRSAASLLLCGALLFVPHAAMAQDAADSSDTTQIERPEDYDSSFYVLNMYEIENFSEILELSPPQRETMMRMFEEFRQLVVEGEAVHRRYWLQIREFSQTVRVGEDHEILEKIAKLEEMNERYRELLVNFDTYQDRLAEEFFSDLELLLLPGQLEKLDDALRWRNRVRLLSDEGIPYGNFSVTDLGRSMELQVAPVHRADDGSVSLSRLYQEYEVELDRLLLRRAAAEREYAPRAIGSGMSMFGPQAIESEEDKEKWVEAYGEATMRLVEMQKKYIGRIAALLEPQPAAEFREACYQRAYSYILSESQIERMFAQLFDLEGLTAQQRERIQEVSDVYDEERAEIDALWIERLDELLAEEAVRVACMDQALYSLDTVEEGGRNYNLWAVSVQRVHLHSRWRDRIAALRTELGFEGGSELP